MKLADKETNYAHIKRNILWLIKGNVRMLMESVKNNNSLGKWLYVSAIRIALSEMKSTANAFVKLLFV